MTRAHSWQPVDLLARDSGPPEPPTIADIVYPGRIHDWSGEPESLKSMAAAAVACVEVRAGRCVVYIDFENGPDETLVRLRALGLSDDEVDERFIYLAPDEPLTDPAVRADLERLLAERNPSLVIVDSYTSTLSLHNYEDWKGVAIEAHKRLVLDPLRAHGAAIILLDHVVKNREQRGKFSTGSERKIGACDVHVGFEVVKPFGRGRTGIVRLRVHKDRPAYLSRPYAARLEFHSDATTGRITWGLELEHEGREDDEPPKFRPTFLMERVSRHLEQQTEPVSHRAVTDIVKGKIPYLRSALDCLVGEGYASESIGARNARLVEFVKPFVEAAQPSSSLDCVPTASRDEQDDRVPTASSGFSLNDAASATASHRVPTASSTASSTASPNPLSPLGERFGRDAVVEAPDEPDEFPIIGDVDFPSHLLAARSNGHVTDGEVEQALAAHEFVRARGGGA